MGPWMPKLIRWGLIAAGVILLGLALNTTRQYARWSPFGEPPDARAARLAEHWRLLLPEGPGPFPAAILLSGCDGVRDNMDYWASVFVETGRAALIVDSHTPRGLVELEAWRLVCGAQALSGAERSGDVAVALKGLSDRDDIADDIVVFGASHGGWTAMEFVAHAASNERPPGLAHWPDTPEALLQSVSALVLLYPYCGVLNSATAARWAGAPPALFVLAEDDSIVSTPDCVARAEALRQSNAEVEIVVLADADHGFDQQERSPLSMLRFDAQKQAQARRAVLDFLKTVDPL